MATIHRHRTPADSYDPNRPLNDLGRDQLKHFIHVAERLPPGQKIVLPVPSPEDGLAAGQFIAAVTQHLLNLRGPRLKVVAKKIAKRASKAVPRPVPGVVPAIAAGSEAAREAAPEQAPKRASKRGAPASSTTASPPAKSSGKGSRK